MWICWKVTYWLLFLYGGFCSFENETTPKWTSYVGLQGRSVMFPMKISQHGSVRAEGGGNIAILFDGKFRIFEKTFTNRVHWDNETGYLSFHNLRTKDSGKYFIENLNAAIKYEFQLTVYEEVPQPQMSLDDESSCTWLCSVENGRNVTLAWYKENEPLNQTSNPDSNISLSLHLKADNSSTYDCVAYNPASNQTIQLLHSDTQVCFVSPDPDPKDDLMIISVILSVVGVILVGGIFLFLRRRKHLQAQSANEERQNDVQYSEILHSNIRQTQGHGPHVPELCTEGEEPLLTSVYAKIQPHPPKATGTDSNGTRSGSAVLGRL